MKLKKIMKSIKEAFLDFVILIAVTIPVLSVSILVAISFFPGISEDLPSWAQAFGTIIAVFSGYTLAIKQNKDRQKKRHDEECTRAKTIYFLTHDAFNLVCARLNNAFAPPSKQIRFLQKARTTEMIDAMKGFYIAHVPVDMLQDFIQIRSQLVAMNEGINTYHDAKEKNDAAREKNDAAREKNDVEKHLKSSIRVLAKAEKSWSELSKVTSNRFYVNGKCSPVAKYSKLQEKLKELREEKEWLRFCMDS